MKKNTKNISEMSAITKENINIYKEYLDIKTLFGLTNLSGAKVIKLYISTILSITFMASLIKYMNMGNLVINGLILLISELMIPCSLIGLNYKRTIKKFQKQYPDFDTSLNLSDVHKLLKEYYNNEIYEKIVIKTENENFEINNKKDSVNVLEDIPLDEKKVILQKEKEFWQQEKNQNHSELEQNYHQKKMKVLK